VAPSAVAGHRDPEEIALSEPGRLAAIRVVDFSTGIAGGYATKLLADAGADVIKVEPPGGDPLRRRSAARGPLPEGEDGALFRFLHASKRGVVGGSGDEEVRALVAGADLVVESTVPGMDDGGPEGRALRAADPRLVVLSISPYGQTGPYVGRPWSEFTIQAECGSIAGRGLPEDPPIMAGGQTTFWIGGTFAAVAALAATQRARRTGHGEWIDFSLLEVMNIAAGLYGDLMTSLAGRPELTQPARTVEIPSIEPTLDGWVGFNTNSRQQFEDFLLLIEKTAWRGDEGLAAIATRWERRDEWNAGVREWTTRHTTAEIVERASLLRIPVAPVHDGATVLQHEHFRARGVFVKNPRGGFLQPRSPYLIDGTGARALAPAPTLGQHTGAIEARDRAAPASEGGERELPLAGVRVLDATAWWAGPSSTQMLATLGADVIHLEAAHRPDGMRMVGGMFFGQHERWWEYSGLFLGANLNKRGLTLNLADERGRDICMRLIEQCDVFVENYSPRVVEQFGLDWEAVHARSPRTVMVRMPAFGLSGPWRDHVGFAQTMEQITGLAWLTGHEHDQPRIQRGPCDPLAGMHAAFATLVALQERERTGRGSLVECAMVEGALNAAAEQIVEFGAEGFRMERDGNRFFGAAPQGLYRCRGEEQWLALSIEDDEQWAALCRVVGDPEWMQAQDLETLRGRRAAHDRIDDQLSAWTAERDLDRTLKELLAEGIPAAPVFDGRAAYLHPQLVAHGFFEELHHSEVGQHPIPIVPFRYVSRDEAGEPWIRRPTPTLGEHNREILGGLLGVDDEALARLEEEGVIGSAPRF
jgi:crotonobetainyl-CoA:carnitine CoA-transferase CaiB-like acyl-CoA transferase